MYIIYLMVCKAIFAFKIGEKVLTSIFFKFTICVPVLYGITTSFYLNKIRLFLICMGKEERFLYEVSDFFENSSSGTSIKLTFLHPFRLCFNFIAFSFVFIDPLFYFLIFKFRNSHTTSVQGNNVSYVGISEAEKALRKEKNIVSTHVNFTVWLFEVIFEDISKTKFLFTIASWLVSHNSDFYRP